MRVKTSCSLIKGLLACLLLLLFNFVLGMSVVSAETTEVISEKNEFGGKTVKIVYSNNDEEAMNITKVVNYFSNNEKVVKKEIFFTDKYANEKGFSRWIKYFDNLGKMTKRDNFLTAEYANKYGVNRTISYLDSNEAIVKNENFLTDAFANEIGANRNIQYVDSTGKITKSEFYLNDKLIKTVNK